jgi:hypothetical protein
MEVFVSLAYNFSVWCSEPYLTKQVMHAVARQSDCLLPEGRQSTKGKEVYVPKQAVERVAEQPMERI